MKFPARRFAQIAIILLLVFTVGTIVSAQGTGRPRIRFFHAVIGGTNVDLYVDDQLIFNNIAYRGTSGYRDLEPGNRVVRLYPAGTRENAVLEITLPYENGKDYTLVAVGKDGNFGGHQFVDDVTLPPPGKSRIRIIHAAPDAPVVDVCQTGSTGCFFEDVAYTQATNPYIRLDSGTYSFDFRRANTNETALTVPNLTFQSQLIYTLVAIGVPGGSPPIELISVVDSGRAPVYPSKSGAFLTPTMAGVLGGILLAFGSISWLIWRQMRLLIRRKYNR